MKIQAIIPCAGTGLRLKLSVIKPLVLLEKKPIFVYCLEVFQKCFLVDSVIVVVHRQYVKDFKKIIKKYHLTKVIDVVVGGKNRCEKLLRDCIKTAKRFSAAIAATALTSTIKKVDIRTMRIKQTLDRTKLFAAQTPQVFKKDLIVKAYENICAGAPTDEAMLVEQMGLDVKIVLGSYENIKITTSEDLIFAQNLIKKKEKLCCKK